MLIDALGPIKDFMRYLNDIRLCKTPCRVVFLPQHDSISLGCRTGFAVYVANQRLMYVAGNCKCNDRKMILQSVAHEYIHHLQNVEGRPLDEDEAYFQADHLVSKYLAEKRCKKTE